MAETEPVVITFGGGVHSRRRIGDIDSNECVAGSENFDLEPQFLALTPRKPFDRVATAPNAGAIRGYAQLCKTDGTLTTLIQARDKVYSWTGADVDSDVLPDGSTTDFKVVASVNSSSRLRGGIAHNFLLENITIITDLEKVETVKKWDGTAFGQFNHNLGGDLFAKYCRVFGERAWLGNVETTIDTPHVVLASVRGSSEEMSNADRPISSLGLDSAFFLPMPDLRPINAMELTFGEFLFSTERGRLYQLSGSSAFDYFMNEFYNIKGVVGDEAVVNVGNDLMVGLPGRIESLSGVLEFGDVQANDASIEISDQVDGVSSWRLFYDKNSEHIYAFGKNEAGVFIAHKRLLDQSDLSPWSKWTTTHPMGFNPVTVMPMIDPLTMLDAIYMGDESGNIYRMDGTGDLDGGTDAVKVKRRSGLIQVPAGNVFELKGWVSYRRLFQTTLNINILWSGKEEFTQSIQVQLPDNENIAVYGGDHYYGDNQTFYGAEFSQRIRIQDWEAAGLSSHFQLEVEFDAESAVHIEEVGFSFDTEDTQT